MSRTASLEKQLEWEEKIRQQKLSDLSIGNWCRQNHVNACSFYYWKKRLLAPAQCKRSLIARKKFFPIFPINCFYWRAFGLF